MKNPLKITQDVLNGMIGIGGIPTNQEFYDEFNDRLKSALSLHNVVGQSEQLFAFGEHLQKNLGCFLSTEHLQQEIDSFKGK